MHAPDFQRQHFDVWFLFTAVALVIFGTTMVYSSSAVFALERYGDSYFFLKRSLAFAAGGFLLLSFATAIDYHRYRRIVYVIMLAVAVLVGLVFIPGIGRSAAGATRWLKIGPFGFQPSEAAKIATVLFLAYSLEKKAPRIRTFAVGIFPNMVIVGLLSTLILVQKDLGSAVILMMMTWLLLFAAGARLRYLFGMLAGLVPVATILIMGSPYRRQRILAFLNPWNDQYGSGFQMIQSFVAFNEGGVFGRGLGEGQQKLFYLPEAHTDFILSVIGEELGLLGVVAIAALFLIFCYRGIRIALDAPDLFGRYLALGMTLLIGLEAMLNMGVVMGMLPTKGLALPFVSYGGSSLMMSLLAVGVVLNVSSYRSSERHAE
ncbi:MAG: putative lipid II flippase FtsW [Deltaproteobacteria bacterium]|nr:putative lipid II flippase FtsW [Deltaproteobacteria bacterium]